METGNGDRGIYNERYAERYEALYLHPWSRKHQLNRRVLLSLLPTLEPHGRWLDLACGQAWHFSAVPSALAKIGVDVSAAQLRRARRRCPASFIRADISRVAFPPASFDLVTAFWAGYCYLADQSAIENLIRTATTWIRPGGALYLEMLPPESLRTFNSSRFAESTGFRVHPRRPDFVEWWYEDEGGRHEMTSPPVEQLLRVVVPGFGRVEAQPDDGFMTHVVATMRLLPTGSAGHSA